MATFSMQDLMDQEPGGAFNARSTRLFGNQGGEPAVGRRRRRLATDTAALIRKFMAEQTEPVLLLDICDYLERRPGPHLRRILREMVQDGELIQTEDFGAGPLVPRHWFTRP